MFLKSLIGEKEGRIWGWGNGWYRIWREFCFCFYGKLSIFIIWKEGDSWKGEDGFEEIRK